MPVIVLAERAEPADALAAAQLGARALLPKNCTLAELSVAIRSAICRRPGAASARALTARQREVLELIVEGLDNAQIAARLGITERTVRAHVSGVLERPGVANRTQAAVAAIQRGWVATLPADSWCCWHACAATALPRSSTPAAPARSARRARCARPAARRARGCTTAGPAATVFKWQAGAAARAGVGAEAGDHGHRA